MQDAYSTDQWLTALPVGCVMVTDCRGGSTVTYTGPPPAAPAPAFTQYWRILYPAGAVTVTDCGSPVVSTLPEVSGLHTSGAAAAGFHPPKPAVPRNVAATMTTSAVAMVAARAQAADVVFSDRAIWVWMRASSEVSTVHPPGVSVLRGGVCLTRESSPEVFWRRKLAALLSVRRDDPVWLAGAPCSAR